MSVSDMGSIFSFVGGIGMFLYGMNIMADGMQKTAGGKMSHLLSVLTSNRLVAVAVGALVTAVIQSSGATTVMVVGFVNAGILSLSQAVGVIMGANIGTTITAWIVSMSQLGDAANMLKPSFIAPVLIGVGAVFFLFTKSQKKKLAGEICMGLGFLFMGLDFMSSAMSPYTDSPVFSKAFTMLGGNPLLGMLVGLVVTAILQSSSASVGILQMLSANGVVTANSAVYITLGQNIGSCVTALISCVGANRTAKRAAVIHLMFNIAGAIIFGGVLYIVFLTNQSIAGMLVNPVEISIFHTIFNLSNTLLLFPFANLLVKLSGLVVREHPGEGQTLSREEKMVSDMEKRLDNRFLETSFMAMETATNEVVEMGAITLRNLKRAMRALLEEDKERVEKALRTEDALDKINEMLTNYLVKVSNLSLNERQHEQLNNLFYAINDIERVGDRAENIVETAQYMMDHDLHFSQEAREELKLIGDKAIDGFYNAIEARRTDKVEFIRKVSQDEDEVDLLEEELRERHIARLSQHQCDSSSGVSFLDVISNLERISDHAYNIAGYVKNEM